MLDSKCLETALDPNLGGLRVWKIQSRSGSAFAEKGKMKTFTTDIAVKGAEDAGAIANEFNLPLTGNMIGELSGSSGFQPLEGAAALEDGDAEDGDAEDGDDDARVVLLKRPAAVPPKGSGAKRSNKSALWQLVHQSQKLQVETRSLARRCESDSINRARGEMLDKIIQANNEECLHLQEMLASGGGGEPSLEKLQQLMATLKKEFKIASHLLGVPKPKSKATAKAQVAR